MVDTLTGIRKTLAIDTAGAPVDPPTEAGQATQSATLAAIQTLLQRGKTQTEIYKAASTADNNAELLAGAAYYLTQVRAVNTTGAVIYLKLYDKTASPNPAVDTARTVIALTPGNNVIDTAGRHFPTGVAMALVTGAAADDNTAVTAGAIVALTIGLSPMD